jgi:sulfoxide reductase heme-binding subunit YedZ
MIAIAAASPLWYLTRGTGLVTLVLLTIAMVLGILQVVRWAPLGSPRFVIVALHRAVSLFVLVFLAVHVATAVLDSFAPIRLLDAFVPFAGTYRPLWLGLGALALDAILAVTLTSLVRNRLGLRTWRAVHWLSYACWPVAILHGWGAGSDARSGWMLAITLGCAAAVLAALAWRLARGWPARAGVRAAAAGATAALALFVGLWLPSGPLASGWARRSGTPAKLLAAPAPAPAARRAPAARSGPAPLRPFAADLHGTLRQGTSAGGMAIVDLSLRLSGGARGALRMRLAGAPTAGGGVLMRRSAVTFHLAGTPAPFRGRIGSLRGTSLTALVGARGGRALRLRAQLRLSGATVDGTVSGRPLAGAAG